MQAVETQAFEGRVIFHTRHSSLKTEAHADALISAARLACPDLFPKYEREIEEACLLVSATEDVRFAFQGDEMPMLTHFQDFWKQLEKARKPKDGSEQAQAQAICDWRMETHWTIKNAWVEIFNATHKPFRDPVRLPKAMLTPEEREALNDSGHPLPSPGSPTAAASANASAGG